MRILIWIALLTASVTIADAQSKTGNSSGADAVALPPDVNPVTYSRFPPLMREELKDAATRKFYDDQPPVSASGASLYQRGPQHMILYSPALAETAGVMGGLEKQGVLGKRLTEVAILVTAREMNQQFVWTAHEIPAPKNGVEQVLVDTIKFNKDLSGLGEKEATIIQYGRQLLREKKIGADLFARAVKLFGYQGVVELTGTIGHYVGVGIMLNAADQHLPPGRQALLPTP